jgi:hypothetical protein
MMVRFDVGGKNFEHEIRTERSRRMGRTCAAEPHRSTRFGLELTSDLQEDCDRLYVYSSTLENGIPCLDFLEGFYAILIAKK